MHQNRKSIPTNSLIQRPTITMHQWIAGSVYDSTEQHNPEQAVKELQNDPRCAFQSAQCEVLNQLRLREAREFNSLLVCESFSDILKGCIAVQGSVFDKLLDPWLHYSGGSSNGVFSRFNQMFQEWVELLSKEFEYLSAVDTWNGDHLRLALHAANMMEAVRTAWPEFHVSSVQAGFEVSLNRLIHSPGFTNTLHQVDCLDHACVANTVVKLALSLKGSIPREEVLNLIPTLFRACQVLNPKDFGRPPDESRNDRLSIGDKLRDELHDVWMEALVVAIEAIELDPKAKHHCPMLAHIITKAPPSLPIQEDILNALLAVDPAEVERILPLTLERRLKQKKDYTYGALALIAVTHVSAKSEDLITPDSKLMLMRVLNQLESDQAELLLDAAVDLLRRKPRLFDNPVEKELLLEEIRAEIQR
jgi:hypothetical protein